MTVFRTLLGAALLVVPGTATTGYAQGESARHQDPYLTTGLFIASIEEGARIFTPVRLLPFDHPEALGHQFPTVEQFHGGEERLLIALGRPAGLQLDATILRYPAQPDSGWPYSGFQRPPADAFASVTPLSLPAESAPLPGLRAVAFLDRFPVAFIIDTRGMSLAARHMERATASGLDITRNDLLTALGRAAEVGPPQGPWVLVYGTARTRAASVYIEGLTWPEVRDAIKAGYSTALVYAGSTEQNGPHMVLGKHTFLAHYVAGRIAEELGDALVYPTLPFAPTGDVAARTGHMHFPGSVSLTGRTFEAVLREVALSAVAAGFHEVYLMGDHGGGQNELRHAAATVQAAVRSKGARVAYIGDVYYKATEQANTYLRAHNIPVGGHAGAYDTAELMAIDSGDQWIRRDKLAPSDSTKFLLTGVSGDPTRATPELGRLLLRYKIEDAAEEIRALRAKPLSGP